MVLWELRPRRASCLLTLPCSWAVNPWIKTFGRFKGWGTENVHTGRGERPWETQVDSWLRKSPTPWRLEMSYCPHHSSIHKGKGTFLSLVGAEHGQCLPMGVTLSSLGKPFCCWCCCCCLTSAVTNCHLTHQSPRQPEQRATNPRQAGGRQHSVTQVNFSLEI